MGGAIIAWHCVPASALNEVTLGEISGRMVMQVRENTIWADTYDVVDHRTFSSENGLSTFTFNAAGQILVGNALGVLSTYTYDNDGNNSVVQTGVTLVTMSYGQESQMTVHNSGATLNTFTYKPDSMKRTEKLGATTTILIWDGSDYLQGRS